MISYYNLVIVFGKELICNYGKDGFHTSMIYKLQEVRPLSIETIEEIVMKAKFRF